MQVAVALVHRDRPERVRRRQLPAREADPVAVAAAQGAPAAVGDGRRVDGLGRRVGAQREPGDHGAPEVVAAVVADVAERHQPAVVAHAAVRVHVRDGAGDQPRPGPGPASSAARTAPLAWRGGREPRRRSRPCGTRAGRRRRPSAAGWRPAPRRAGRGRRGPWAARARSAAAGTPAGRSGSALARRPGRQRREPVLAHQLGDRREVGGVVHERAADQPDQVGGAAGCARRRRAAPPSTRAARARRTRAWCRWCAGPRRRTCSSTRP